MSDIYVGELQDEDGNTVYPHTEADVCFCTDGKNVQEKINNELLSNTKVLKTIEEIEANTNVENIAGATALKEVNNKLMFPDGTEFYLDEHDGERGYNTEPARGADTFIPFRKIIPLTLLKYFHKSHNGNTETHTYTLTEDVNTLLVQYITVLGDAASNLPRVTVDGIAKTGFTYRQLPISNPAPTFAYSLVLTDLKKGNTLVMVSPYWGTNAYELQLWGC